MSSFPLSGPMPAPSPCSTPTPAGSRSRFTSARPTASTALGLNGHGVTGWCVLNARALLVRDVTTEPRYIAVRTAARCEMAAPMRDGEQVIGVIDLESDRTGHFTAGDLALLEQLTIEATLIVQQLWRMRALQAKARQLETLLTTDQAIVAKLESQELLDTLTRDGRQPGQQLGKGVHLGATGPEAQAWPLGPQIHNLALNPLHCPPQRWL